MNKCVRPEPLLTLILSLLFGFLFAQGETQAITLQLDSITLRCEVLLNDPEVKYELDLLYFSYYRDTILNNQGGHTGRLLHGDYQEIDLDGKLRKQGTYQAGLQEGNWKEWNTTGTLRSIYHYQTGRREGSFQEFDAKGDLTRDGRYKHNLLDGKIKSYTNGELTATERFRQGVLISEEEEVEKVNQPQPDRRITANPPKEKKRNNRREEQPDAVSGNSTPSQSRNGLPQKVAVNLARMPKRSIAIFIVSKIDGSPVVSANVKIARYAANQRDHAPSSGFSGDDGVYYLLRDSADYVISVKHPGFEATSVRINEHDQRTNFLLELSPEAVCGTVEGSIQRTDVAVGIGTVHLLAFDQQGKEVTATYSDLNGNFTLCLPCGRLYRLQLIKDNYHPLDEELYLTETCQSASTQLSLLLNKRQTASVPGKVIPSAAATVPEPPAVPVKTTTAVLPPTATPSSTPVSQPAATTGTGRGWAPREELPQSNATSKGVSFAVVAGSFAKKGNADVRLIDVKKAGFTDAALEKSKDGELYTVVVGRFTDRSLAMRTNLDFRRKTQLKSFVRED